MQFSGPVGFVLHNLSRWPNFSGPAAVCSCSAEHSIENQLPFLQYMAAYAGHAPTSKRSSRAASAQFPQDCTIAPISIGWLGSAQEVDTIAAALAAVIRRHTPGSILLIATSDFTHAVRREMCALRIRGVWEEHLLLQAASAAKAKSHPSHVVGLHYCSCRQPDGPGLQMLTRAAARATLDDYSRCCGHALAVLRGPPTERHQLPPG
jgi:predicted class III extradiol MEMO1 family dioxygenase